MTDQEIIDAHLRDPVAREDVRRATFAYHYDHFSRHPKAHNFPIPFHGSTEAREQECLWCRRARWQIRWDEQSPECTARPESANESIGNIIVREEALFARVRDRARKLAANLDVTAITGAELAHTHHTHGIDPSMLESVLFELGKPTIPERAHEDYIIEYAKHRQTGAAGFKAEIITAKTS